MSNPDIAPLIAEVERALAEATPGEWFVTDQPWRGYAYGVASTCCNEQPVLVECREHKGNASQANAILIALARNAMPRLLAHLEDVERQRNEARTLAVQAADLLTDMRTSWEPPRRDGLYEASQKLCLRIEEQPWYDEAHEG